MNRMTVSAAAAAAAVSGVALAGPLEVTPCDGGVSTITVCGGDLLVWDLDGPLEGPAEVFPSEALVADGLGTITDVNVEIIGGSFFVFMEDLEITLRHVPSDTIVTLMQDAGGSGGINALFDEFIFDDQAAGPIPETVVGVISGTFQPSIYETPQTTAPGCQRCGSCGFQWPGSKRCLGVVCV